MTQVTPLENEQLKKDMAFIEAALYVAGRPLDLGMLASVVKTRSIKRVQTAARALVADYQTRNFALEVIELKDGRFVLQLKPSYVVNVRKLAMSKLLGMGPLRTLSYVAYRQPVPQSRVIAVRGHQAYKHIQRLGDLGLVTREGLGRTKILRTTEGFADYFNLSHDLTTMKRQLQTLFKEPPKES